MTKSKKKVPVGTAVKKVVKKAVTKAAPVKTGPVVSRLEACKRNKRNHWLMKSEPDTYNIDDLKRDRIEMWGGVRNYQARNIMRDLMAVGDDVIFYHSSATPPGAAGMATVHRLGVPDPDQFNPASPYFDPKSKPEAPTWICVEVKYAATFKNFVTIEQIKERKELHDTLLVQKGQRLSIQPLTKAEFDAIVRLGT